MPQPATTGSPSTPPALTDMPVLRQIEGQPLSRSLSIEKDTIDKDERTVIVAVSSEYAVSRWFGSEVLDHSPDSVDLTRMKNGAPLLIQHDRYSARGQIGVVEDAWIDDDKVLRARVRFSKSALAEEVWQDVLDGIIRNVSCGYLPHEMVLERSDEHTDHYRLMRWEPYEVSIVSVPADPTVGVGRSHSSSTTITIRGQAMPNSNHNAGGQNSNGEGSKNHQRGDGAQPRDPAQAERTRCSDLLALGARHNQNDLASRAISEGTSVEAFTRELLDNIGGSQTPTPTGQNAGGEQRDLPKFASTQPGQDMGELGVSERELEKYSLMRAINALATGDYKDAGLEREISNAIADKCGTESRGLYMPHEALMRSMVRQQEVKTPAKGGVLVDTDLRTDLYTEILKNRTVMGALGATVLSGLQGDVDIPKQLTEAAFQWLDEDGEATKSDIDFGTIGLSPKTVSGAVSITRKLRKQSSMSIENLVRNELLAGIGLTTDLGYLYGTGEDNQPLGLFYQTGVPGLMYDDKINWDAVVDLETQIATANADSGSLAYLTSVAQRGVAKKSFVATGTGERLWQGNEVNGYRAMASNQVKSDGSWIFGDWAQVLIALWGVVDLKVDTSTKAASDGLILRVFQDVDTTARRKESFAIGRRKPAGA